MTSPLTQPDSPEACFAVIAEQARELVQWAHTAMMQACDDSGVRPQKVGLSAREIEVLRWAAEIASIIDLSERTVNFHINNVVAKLGASNKTNAAVRATLLGLIW